MPGPDPERLWTEEADTGFRVCWQPYDWTGNNGNRRKRAMTILRRLRWGTWRYQWCGDDLPDYVRADALYCREACRKRAARERCAALRPSRLTVRQRS